MSSGEFVTWIVIIAVTFLVIASRVDTVSSVVVMVYGAICGVVARRLGP